MICCLCGCEVQQTNQLASLCSLNEGGKKEGDRDGENRKFPPGFAAVSARRAPLLGQIVTSSRVGVGGDEGGGLIRVEVVEQLRLHTGKHRGMR